MFWFISNVLLLHSNTEVRGNETNEREHFVHGTKRVFIVISELRSRAASPWKFWFETSEGEELLNSSPYCITVFPSLCRVLGNNKLHPFDQSRARYIALRFKTTFSWSHAGITNGCYAPINLIIVRFSTCVVCSHRAFNEHSFSLTVESDFF